MEWFTLKIINMGLIVNYTLVKLREIQDLRSDNMINKYDISACAHGLFSPRVVLQNKDSTTDLEPNLKCNEFQNSSYSQNTTHSNNLRR